MCKFHISTDFPGGNAIIRKIENNTVYLDSDLRDTVGDWFYWAICVSGAEGQTLTFDFGEKVRIGYYGPAVSRDLKHWQWLNSSAYTTFTYNETGFTYTFTENDEKLYFAHNMIYSEEMFSDFAKMNDLQVQTLCESRKKRKIPYVCLGKGSRSVVLTARHHACESTGNYVLEGVLEEFSENLLKDTCVFCVPFVDFDGVVEGDQGKNRAPYDHNRDYVPEKPAIYPAVREIRNYIDTHNVVLGFDFHSPWHDGRENDDVCLIRFSFEKENNMIRFSNLLDACLTPQALQHDIANDVPPNGGWENWNQVGVPTFASYAMRKKENEFACTLETCYFGKTDNIFTQERAKELGRCFAKAIRAYLQA